MNFLTVKKPNIASIFGLIQMLLLASYLALNIINVGEMGTGLLLLVGFLVLAIGLVVIQSIQNSISIYWHFLIFLMFVFWLSIRVIIDLHDLERLKQLTIATTGGVLFFFLLGTFARKALDNLGNSLKSIKSAQFFLIIFCIISITIFQEYGTRLVRTDIFYIDGVDGGYQRPGNFLIILFLMVSFVYLKIASHINTQRILGLMLWFGIYSVGLTFSLISSQMIGSNAATANLIAIYLLTMVISFLGFSKTIRNAFLCNKLSLPLSKRIIVKISQYAMVSAIGVFVVASIVINLSGFDLTTTRAFGFGDSNNSSLDSRLAILKETGLAQLGYAPIFGNVNVAYLITGNAGEILHNFIPNIIAELGLVGLVIVTILFFLVFKTLVMNIRNTVINEQGFQKSIINFWLIVIFIYLFIYANFTVGKGWLVMWFFLGFAVSVFKFKGCSNKHLDL